MYDMTYILHDYKDYLLFSLLAPSQLLIFLHIKENNICVPEAREINNWWCTTTYFNLKRALKPNKTLLYNTAAKNYMYNGM